MVKLYNISEWHEQAWYNTGGTRNKKLLLNPDDGESYFFKESLNRVGRNYQHEFWSEILASHIGMATGFNVLEYHIGVNEETIGCISKSMFKLDETEELIEGIKYLQAYNPDFNPEIKERRDEYSFNFIINSLKKVNLSSLIPDILEIIIFDAFIGNSDRHQENWATINKHSSLSSSMSFITRSIENNQFEGISNLIKKLILWLYTKKGKLRPQIQQSRLILPKQTKLSPIYDSGCSFGRELNDNRIDEMLANEVMLIDYIRSGKSEIHWEGEKLNHFDLILKIAENFLYKSYVIKHLERLIDNYNANEIKSIINSIDDPVQQTGHERFLPDNRKQFACTTLNLRYQQLVETRNALR
jgi:hypothetical protein